MLLLSKVKNRFWTLLVLLLCPGILWLVHLVAQEAARLPTVAELAVSDPLPPILVPPVLDQAGVKPVSLRIDLDRQRLKLLVGGEMAIDSPITTGRKNSQTPTGKFEIEKKEPSWKQEKYGDFVNADGETILAGVYATLDPLPSGLVFKPLTLGHVLFLKDQEFMIHAGVVGTLPTSDGAIIVPAEVAKTLFGRIPVGCPVEIISD